MTKQRKNRVVTAQQVSLLLSRYGKKSSELAQKTILEEKIENHHIREGLNYFIQELWFDDEYPGLMALACKAVGGKPHRTTKIGASLVLLRGAMDIHDDIIDKQEKKGGQPTLLGKYGQDIAILVGDILFYEGLTHLNDAILHFRTIERQKIAHMVKEALFEVGTGVAGEIRFRGDFNLMPETLMKIVNQKSACSEMHARIGAIVGGGTKAEEDALGIFGRLSGMLTMIRDEFIDIYEIAELENRKEMECLPLPLLFAFRDANVKKEVLPILEKRRLSKSDSRRIIDIISQSAGVKELKRHMDELERISRASLEVLKDKRTSKTMCSLLDPLYEDIEIG